MANNGPFCKGVENDKGNIFEPELWKKQGMYNGAFLKSLRIVVYTCLKSDLTHLHSPVRTFTAHTHTMKVPAKR